jgi:hypothetical protein
MADKIGVLGEATTLTAATTTVYTCPAAKAAKGRIMYSFQGAADGTTDLTITVNGIDVEVIVNVAASGRIWSTTAFLANATAAGATSTAPIGTAVATTVGPAPIDYYLSAADTVTYTIGGTTALVMNIQFVGTEVDV